MCFLFHIFKFNIVSVSALTFNSGIKVTFIDFGFSLHDIHSSRMIGKGKCHDDLYMLNGEDEESSSHIINQVTSEVWRSRLGHISYKHMSL